MLQSIKTQNKNEITVPSYNELTQSLHKKRESLLSIKTAQTMQLKLNEDDELLSKISKRNSLFSFNQSQPIKRTLTETNNSNNSKAYNIPFKETSTHNVIIPDLNNPSHCKINLLFGDENEYNEKIKERDELIDNIKKLEDKINDSNEKMDMIKNNISKMSEDNFKLVSERKKEQRNHEMTLKQIPIIRNDIKNIKTKIDENGKEKIEFNKEMMKIKKEIETIDERTKILKGKIEKQIKENTKIQHQLKLQRDKNNELKAILNPYQGESSQFIKDITELIPPKQKDVKIISNTLA